MPHRYRPYAVLAAVASAALFLGGCSASDQASPPPGTAGGAGSPVSTASTSGSSGTATPTGSPTTPAPPSSPTSATATPKPTATAGGGAGAPGVPAAARQHTDKGAEAFARHYVDVINETGIKPVQGKLEPLAADSCKSCANHASTVAYFVNHEQHYSSPIFRVFDTSASAKSQSVDTIIDVTVKQLPTKVLDNTNEVVETVPANSAVLVFDLGWTAHGWQVANIRVRETASS